MRSCVCNCVKVAGESRRPPDRADSRQSAFQVRLTVADLHRSADLDLLVSLSCESDFDEPLHVHDLLRSEATGEAVGIDTQCLFQFSPLLM